MCAIINSVDGLLIFFDSTPCLWFTNSSQSLKPSIDRFIIIIVTPITIIYINAFKWLTINYQANINGKTYCIANLSVDCRWHLTTWKRKKLSKLMGVHAFLLSIDELFVCDFSYSFKCSHVHKAKHDQHLGFDCTTIQYLISCISEV